jgi:hypothetical protein
MAEGRGRHRPREGQGSNPVDVHGLITDKGAWEAAHIELQPIKGGQRLSISAVTGPIGLVVVTGVFLLLLGVEGALAAAILILALVAGSTPQLLSLRASHASLRPRRAKPPDDLRGD